MSKDTRRKNQERAARLKEAGIERTTGQCPMGCGRSIKNGGNPLLNHLMTCKGRKRGFN